MHACMYICMYARMYVCMYVCMHVCMYTCMCMHACMNACMYACLFVEWLVGCVLRPTAAPRQPHMHVCMYTVCMYARMCMHVYMHVCIHVCMHIWFTSIYFCYVSVWGLYRFYDVVICDIKRCGINASQREIISWTTETFLSNSSSLIPKV